MARPKLDINPRKVQQLAALAMTDAEIAAVLDCAESTLKARFSAPLKRGRQLMRASLKRVQFKVALSGNPTMLIWLGKQHLGQRDTPEPEGDDMKRAPMPPQITFVEKDARDPAREQR